MIKWSIKNRKITLLFAVIIAIAGIISFVQMPKQENPNFNAPFAMVTTIYPGASPEDVKDIVTTKIEKRIKEIQGVKTTFSQSRNSASIVVLELDTGVDVDKAWDELYRVMAQEQNQLPKECLSIEVNTDLYKTTGMMISLSSGTYNYDQLENFAKPYIKELKKIEGLATFEIVGEQEKQIMIEVDVARLNSLPLSLEDISKIVGSQNIKIPAGQLDSKNGKVSINTTGTYTSIEDIKNLVLLISEKDGSALRLKDVATVEFTYTEDNYKIQHEGVNGILLTAYFKEGQNVLAIGDKVKDTINKVSDEMPEELKVNYILYQPDDVGVALKDFMTNLIGGIIIVIIVVFLGLGFRNAIIVSVAIPLSMMATFLMMPVMGIEIHQISIVGLIIALGMLVDNAIVVSDAIQVEIDTGVDRLKACVQGVKQVAIPVLTSTLTTIGTFVAVLLLSGMAGEFISTLPKILIVALIASYLIALFTTPALAYIFFKPSEEKSDHLKGVKKIFGNLLKLGLRRRKTTLLLGGGGILLAGLFLLGINISIFPIADNGVLYIDINSDGIDDMNRTEELVTEIEELLMMEDAVTTYTTALGGGLPKFYYTMGVYPRTNDFAQIMVRFDLSKDKRFKDQKQYEEYVQQRIDEDIVGGSIQASLLKQAKPVPQLKYIITGEDQEVLRVTGDEIKRLMMETQGTETVHSDYSPEEFQFYVEVNPSIGMYYGISKYDVQKELSLAIAGREISTFVSDGMESPIMIRGNMKDIDAINNFGVKSSVLNKKAMVKQVAEVSLSKQTTNIKTYNEEYAIIISGNAKKGYNPTALANEIEAKIELEGFTGVEITEAGEKANIKEMFGDVGIIAVIAILLVYSILLIQFKSYIQPILICSTLPLACVGSLFGLFITRQELSFTALIGMVALIGIVVNNAIVLLDFINEEQSMGKPVREACIDAVDKRFRPIMLSSFTTIMGLVPLALSGSVLFTPMSVALIFGILISTLLTLVFFPVIYYMVYKEKNIDLKEVQAK